MPLRRIFIDGIDGQMHVRISNTVSQNNTIPLYCIHQSPSSSIVYEPIIETMQSNRTVAAGDTPGFGESFPPKIIPDIEYYAKAHGHILDKLKFNQKVDLMGYFTGSKIAIELAIQRPKQIRKIILFGIPIYNNQELKDEKEFYKKDKYSWDGAHIKKWWNHLKKNAPSNYPIELFIKHFTEIQKGGINSWWGHHAAFNFIPEVHLPRLKVPVMVFCTKDAQGEKSKRAEKYIKKSIFINLPFEGQGALDLHTKVITDHMNRFLDHEYNL